MRTLLLLLAVAAPLLARPVMHEPPVPPDASRPTLVRDTPFQEAAPRRFRTSQQLAEAWSGDRQGLAELRCSGSATLSAGSLAWVREQLKQPFIVVDLRQESHGLLNGAAVEWEAQDNWANVGLSREQVLSREKDALALLAAAPQVVLPYEREPAADPELVQVQKVQSEEELVRSQGEKYERLTVSDHARPTDEEVDRFVRFVDGLPPETWLHFHCRAGVGRTTTFMALYDMLRNARKVSFDEILERQAALPPNFQLLEIRPDRREQFAQDRADFAHWFYRFAQERKAGETWSNWLSHQP